MQPMFPAMNSLRRKIVFAYGAIAALVVGLSVFAVVETRLIEMQIAAGGRIGQFLGIALEIRRFEKNYFLYRQASDLEETQRYLLQAQALLREHAKDFTAFESPARITELHQALDNYGALIAIPMAASAVAADPLLEARIRETGKSIATAAEEWSRAERQLLQEQLARHRTSLLASIMVVTLLVIALGQWLAWRVARPLKRMEESMEAIAAGRSVKLDLATSDREIDSLTLAFNRVLHELELRQGQLVRSDKLAALGTLLSGVAHELNNPLSNISTSCEILREEIGTDSTAFKQELLEQIDTETWRARRIVRSLLDYARDRDFRRETVPLAALVEESLRLVRPQIPVQIEIRTDIPADLSASGDKQRLQQALFNLIGNALDALEGAGTLVIAARATSLPCPADTLVFGQSPEAAVEIEVRDDGHGISPEVLPRIFDPFFTTKDVGRGLGLGLFIVFEIIEEHGGCLAVKSAPGEGSTFLIRLPLQDATP